MARSLLLLAAPRKERGAWGLLLAPLPEGLGRWAPAPVLGSRTASRSLTRLVASPWRRHCRDSCLLCPVCCTRGPLPSPAGAVHACSRSADATGTPGHGTEGRGAGAGASHRALGSAAPRGTAFAVGTACGPSQRVQGDTGRLPGGRCWVPVLTFPFLGGAAPLHLQMGSYRHWFLEN